MLTPFWTTCDDRVRLFQGDCLNVLTQLPGALADVVFADPPYFLSNGGTTCHGGRRVAVDKGHWDQSHGLESDLEFHGRWLAACQRVLKPHGSLWVSGTHHTIHSIGFALARLGFKILNDVIWEKPNPPPNLSCRRFTHATETLIWAARDNSSRHVFQYQTMRKLNGGRQMKNVWRLLPPRKSERALGRHPTQKPIALLERILNASCKHDALVLDPFNGSGTTGVAAVGLGHRYVGIDCQGDYLELTQRRIQAATDAQRKEA